MPEVMTLNLAKMNRYMHSTPLSETNMFDRNIVCLSHYLTSLLTSILRYKMQFQSNSATEKFLI